MAQNQNDITLGVLNAVEENNRITQRTLAKELGVALGLVNSYLKRCIKKGYVKVRMAPASRYAYYLTPTGFSEKSRLTAEYLSQSFSFFRNAKAQCGELLAQCEANNWRNVSLAGVSDLAEIVVLCALEHPVSIDCIIDADRAGEEFCGLPVVASPQDAPFDAVILTHLADTQSHYQSLAENVREEQILFPEILGVSRTGSAKPTAGRPRKPRSRKQ